MLVTVCSLYLSLIVLLDTSIAGQTAQAWVFPSNTGIRPNALCFRGFQTRGVIVSLLRCNDRATTTIQLLKGNDSSSSEEGQGNDENLDVQSEPNRQTETPENFFAVSPRKVVFTPVGHVPPYEWKIPQGTGVNPAVRDVSFYRLLMEDVFIDKSAALYNFLKWWFIEKSQDFDPTPLHMVFPRRFAKTTLMGFIEAVFSPVPLLLDEFTLEDVKTKIASLEYGTQLLNFGMHPVIRLNMQRVESISDLNTHIGLQLKLAGLDVAFKDHTSPADRLFQGAILLNQQFKEKFGVSTKSIVLIDEHDRPFRKEPTEAEKPFMSALIALFSLCKEDNSAISLLILCGLTRMMGTGLSLINNLVDVSRKSKFHGLCGISAQEFVESCSGKLDEYAVKRFEGQTLKDVLKNKFAEDWDGFRFGVDSDELELNPETPEGALFSPLDVWEIVQVLSRKKETPSSKWISSMKSEFEFTTFADKYVSSKESGFIELYRNLQGGWVDTENPLFAMERKDYLKLSENLHVQKVLFELGFLSVKEIAVDNVTDQNMVRLGSPNWLVTKHAMKMLVQKAAHGITPVGLARFYLEDSASGFGALVTAAANEVSKVYRGTGTDVFREYPFQDYLFMELLYRFPEGIAGFPGNYKLFFDKYLNKNYSEAESKGTTASNENEQEMQTENQNQGIAENEIAVGESGQSKKKKGRADIIFSVSYANELEVTFLIELKVAKIEKDDAKSIMTAHAGNIENARAQVATYKWDAPSLVRVAVSGVWHPEKQEFETYLPYKLDAKYEFFHQTIPSNGNLE